jgi:hypothetical protein
MIYKIQEYQVTFEFNSLQITGSVYIEDQTKLTDREIIDEMINRVKNETKLDVSDCYYQIETIALKE